MKTLLSILFSLCFISTCFAQPIDYITSAPLNTEEVDGSPSTFPWKLVFPVGSLTDDSTGTTVSFNPTADITSVGDVTSGAAFDGTQGTLITFNNTGGDATLDYDGTDFTFSKLITAPNFTSNVAIGTQPYAATSTTLNTNLNADLLDSQSGAYYLDSANFTGTNWTDLTDGGATTLHSHATSGDITSVGDCTSGACFDGTQGTTLTFNNAGGDGTIDYDGTDFSISHPITVTGLLNTSVGIDGVGAVDLDYGSADITDHTFITDGTGNAEIVLPNDSIGDAEIDWGTGAGQVNPADFVDQDIGDITITTGDWAVENDSHAHTTTTLSGIDISADTNLSGDTENVLTGDALSIGAGITRDTEWDTSLEILNAVGDETGTGALVFAGSPALTGTPTLNAKGFTYDNVTDNDFEFSDDITIEDTTPHLRLTDTTAAEDDFEIYTDNSQFVLTNITDLIDILYVDSSNNIRLLRNTTFSGTTTLGIVTGVVDAGGATSFEIPNGATPTVDTTGEIAIDTTDDQLLYYGGALRTIPYTYEKCFTVFAPVVGDDNIPIWSPVDAITVTGLYCRVQGGTSAGITISDGTNAMEEVVCSTTGQADDGTLVNNTFTANERVEFDTGTITGTVDFCNMCIRYTVDRQ